MMIQAELTGNQPKKRKDGDIQVLEFTIRRRSLTDEQLLVLDKGFGSDCEIELSIIEQPEFDDDEQPELMGAGG